MDPDPPRRFWLLTYPRTASNLLVRMLALDDQPNLVSSEKRGYFFMPPMTLRMHQLKTVYRRPDEWTQDERARLMESYQSRFEAFQTYADTAEAQGKDIFVKEHVPWLINPIAESKWVFVENITDESACVVKAFSEQRD